MRCGGERGAVAGLEQDAGCGPDPDAGHRGQDAGKRVRIEDLFDLASDLPALIQCVGQGGPTGIRAAGRSRLLTTARKANPRGAEELIDAIWGALAQQTVVVPGTAAADTILPKLARSRTGRDARTGP